MKRRVSLKHTASRKPRKALPKVNRKRKASTLLRAYGPPDRRAWVTMQPCVFCRRVPSAEYPNVNAHIPSRSGMSRKGHYTKVVPSCPACHTALDEKKLPWSRDSLDVMAAITEARWQAHLTRSTPRPTAHGA